MPSFRDAFPDEDRWALSYFVLSLSAYKDPLTLEPLAISDADKQALDSLESQAPTPDKAYVPGGGSATVTDGDGTIEDGVTDVAQGG